MMGQETPSIPPRNGLVRHPRLAVGISPPNSTPGIAPCHGHTTLGIGWLLLQAAPGKAKDLTGKNGGWTGWTVGSAKTRGLRSNKVPQETKVDHEKWGVSRLAKTNRIWAKKWAFDHQRWSFHKQRLFAARKLDVWPSNMWLLPSKNSRIANKKRTENEVANQMLIWFDKVTNEVGTEPMTMAGEIWVCLSKKNKRDPLRTGHTCTEMFSSFLLIQFCEQKVVWNKRRCGFISFPVSSSQLGWSRLWGAVVPIVLGCWWCLFSWSQKPRDALHLEWHPHSNPETHLANTSLFKIR